MIVKRHLGVPKKEGDANLLNRRLQRGYSSIDGRTYGRCSTMKLDVRHAVPS